MEIGSRNELSAYEIGYYTRKAIWLTITAVLLTIVLSYILIANYTSLIERKSFKHIADKYNYELSYSNIYELLSSDNTREGNYIQLADYENQIYILFRYDEETEILKGIDDNTHKDSFYAISKEETNNIKSENSILRNIDKEFNQLSQIGVKGNTESTGGGYSIVLIDTINKQHRICYTNNLLNRKEKKEVTNKEVYKVQQLFNYDESINYKLGILKSIVETENNDSSLNGRIYYTGEGRDNKENENKDQKDDNLKGFVTNNEKYMKEYDSKRYTTYNTIILNPDSNILHSGSPNDTNSGVIIGTCNNNSESISKMESTINIIIKIALLEKTMLM